MSPTKLLDEILSALSRHGPTLIVHLLLAVWLSLRVFDPSHLPSGDALWGVVTGQIDRSLGAVGLSLERWYVLAALAIAYLVTFRWIRLLLTSIPPFRIGFDGRTPPNLLRHAAEVLRLRPELWPVTERLRDVVERTTRELEESGRPHPYEWRNARVTTWYAYYGTLLVALIAVVAWWMQGASYARSAGRVVELALILAGASLGVRWKTRREMARLDLDTAHWALRQTARDREDPRPDPLAWMRGEIVVREARFERAVSRHPSRRLLDLARRWLPERAASGIASRLQPPKWWSPHRDWDILESAAMHFRDEVHAPPRALRVDELVPRFEALLECSGAGLCMLVPFSLGLAPSVPDGGASYCLATRRHGENLLPLRLKATGDLADARLAVTAYSEAPAFLVEVGEYGIERLAQREFPDSDTGTDWSKLVDLDLGDEAWSQLGRREPVRHGAVTLSDRVELHAGSSYLMGVRSELGTRVSAAFQCFRVAGSPNVVVAWRILRASPSEATVPEVLPWWRPGAWANLIQGSPARG